MTTATDTALSDDTTLLRSVPMRPVDWARARRALRALIANPERTDQVFDIVRAVSGKADARVLARILRAPGGRALLAERPNLLAALSDRAVLARLPDGSLGRAYLAFMVAADLTAAGLVEASMQSDDDRAGYGAEARWFFDRLRDMHDLWHVLTGYGRDEAGEAANLAFTYGQIGNPGVGLIVLAAAVLGSRGERFHWQRYLFRAWRRGRRARWLPAVRWEEMLARPLAEVRAALAIDAPEVAHPGGIVVVRRADLPAAAQARLTRAIGETTPR